MNEWIRIETRELESLYAAIVAMDRLIEGVDAEANNVRLDIARLRRRHGGALSRARDREGSTERRQLLSKLEPIEQQRKF